jgi:Domain of unknown function (DUF6434)/SAP domain-containing new25
LAVINTERPSLESVADEREFRSWYYLKQELIAFAKIKGIPTAGGKFELADRVAAYFAKGVVEHKARSRSDIGFDWAKETLSPATIITTSVSFGPNFRNYMKSVIGKKFVCNSDFMDWVRANADKTLHDAAAAWSALEARKRDPAFKTKIRPHNQYNQFTRDFFDDNPWQTLAECRRLWKLKREHNSPMVYRRDDLKLLEES